MLPVIVVLGFLGLKAYTFAGERCSDVVGTKKAPDPPSNLVKNVRIGALTPAEGNETLLVVIPNEHTLIRSLALRLDKGNPELALEGAQAEIVSDLLRADRQAIFAQDFTRTWIVPSPDGRRVKVYVCFGAAAPNERVDPGTYQGELEIRGPYLRTRTIPVTATVRWPNGWVVGLVALVAVLAGLVAKALSDVAIRREEQEGDRAPLLTDLHEYIKEPQALLSIVVGVGFVGYAVFTLYFSNPTFGGPGDWLRLGVFCFVTVVGGMAFTEIAGSVATPRRKKDKGKTDTG
jgi:hypothetical protein